MMLTVKTLSALIGMAAAISLAACPTPKPGAAADPAGPFVRYSVTGTTVTVISAVTPFDAQSKEREAFLHWFKRGFETGYTGGTPLMIEWDETPVAKAGRRGYEFGLEEGERISKQGAAPNGSPITIPIPPAL